MSLNVNQGLQRGAQLMQALNLLVPQVAALITSADKLLPDGSADKDAAKLAYIEGVIRDTQTYSGAQPADLDAVMPAITVVIQQMMAASKVQASVSQAAP